ncbi:hypothetical protein ACFVAM_32135 [Streptomyces californicus]|uniref:hypothetical protein n=1 Tax=Streptomyces californicus TaxID=67351 RepID=UPI0036780958
MLTLIAVMGTLAGALLTGVLQHFAQRAQRMAQEAAERRSAGMDAVAALCVALADHRAAMWDLGTVRLAGGEPEPARAEVRRTRSAVTDPLVRLQFLVPGAGEVARQAVGAVFGMREAQSAVELREARERAAVAAEEVVAVGRGVLV